LGSKGQIGIGPFRPIPSRADDGYLAVMSRERVDRLTDGQREVLRRVNRHMETKEIARELGISPDGVNQRVKAAMRILGVGRRRDAALMLAEAEGQPHYQPLVYQPQDIAFESDPATFGPSTESGREQVPASIGAMREEQAAFKAVPQLRPRRLRLPLPIWGGRPSDLSALQRLGWIFGVMLMIAFAFGVFLAGMEALSRLGRDLS
jgi:DNA-binding CsgD family transcriptional regulator